MKHVVLPLLALLATVMPALADTTYLPAESVLDRLKGALGRQVDVRFSESFATGRLPARDFSGVMVYGLPEGKICLFGQGKGLEPESPGLAPFLGSDGYGDICVPVAEVAVRELAPAVAGAPPAPLHATDTTHCNWLWRSGGGLGLWTEQCRFESGLWEVRYDAAADRFALSVDNGEPYTVLQQFRNPGGALAILPDLKARGMVTDDAECVMAPASAQPVPAGWSAFQVLPTGARKAAFDAQVQQEIPDPPCGPLGYAVNSIGFFMVRAGQPDRVLYVNLGQDGTLIELDSVTFTN
jgi:hypothetical protein